jgi:hypothetical protein
LTPGRIWLGRWFGFRVRRSGVVDRQHFHFNRLIHATNMGGAGCSRNAKTGRILEASRAWDQPLISISICG